MAPNLKHKPRQESVQYGNAEQLVMCIAKSHDHDAAKSKESHQSAKTNLLTKICFSRMQ